MDNLSNAYKFFHAKKDSDKTNFFGCDVSFSNVDGNDLFFVNSFTFASEHDLNDFLSLLKKVKGNDNSLIKNSAEYFRFFEDSEGYNFVWPSDPNGEYFGEVDEIVRIFHRVGNTELLLEWNSDF